MTFLSFWFIGFSLLSLLISVFMVHWFQCSWSISFSVHGPLVSACHQISSSVFPAYRVPINHLWLQETSKAGAICSPSSTITYKQPKRTTEHQYNLQIATSNTEYKHNLQIATSTKQQQNIQIATSNTKYKTFNSHIK